MKRRWLGYVLIGSVFGVADFFYQRLISDWARTRPELVSTAWGRIAHSALILGVWLLPIGLVAWREAKASRGKWRPALAGSLTWLAAVVAYYLYNAFELAVVGAPGRPELHISGRNAPFFWENWKNVAVGDILGGILEWAPIALIGGCAIGWLVGVLYRRLASCSRRPLAAEAADGGRGAA
jgi:hypothetical protein